LRPQTVLLDALGTLIELDPPAPRLRGELGSRYGVRLGEADAERAIAGEIAFYRAHLREGRDAESLAELRRRCAGALRDAMPLDAQARLPAASELVEALLVSLHFRPFPDAEGALVSWRRAKLQLVVVSNWDVSLHDVLSRVGLRSRLDAVLTAAEAGVCKPDARIFEQALGLVGASAASAIHVGDSLEEDVAGARAAGIEPILIRRGGGQRRAGVRTIATLDEAVELS
jgi:putative hydrolase of the HAD superfamily